MVPSSTAQAVTPLPPTVAFPPPVTNLRPSKDWDEPLFQFEPTPFLNWGELSIADGAAEYPLLKVFTEVDVAYTLLLPAQVCPERVLLRL